VLKGNKFLIYGGGLFAGAAVTIATIPSDAVFCVDNRAMCATLAAALDDEPSGNEPQPLGTRTPLIVIASTGSLNVPLYATPTIKV
jgi:hypothetical protein